MRDDETTPTVSDSPIPYEPPAGAGRIARVNAAGPGLPGNPPEGSNIAAAPAPSRGLLTGPAATVLAIVAAVALPVSAFVPPPFGALVSVLAFVAAALSGLAMPAPAWAAGRPVVQGAAVGVAASVLGVAESAAVALPEGPWRLGASAVALVAAWLAGRAAPQLGGAARGP
jgi:hypothetical protein